MGTSSPMVKFASSAQKTMNSTPKQLSWLSRGGDRRGHAPGHVLAHERVENDDELVHTGGERDLLGFARGEQPLVEGSQDGVMLTGHQGAHVRRGPPARPPQIARRPRRRPLSQLSGAAPTSAAICLR